MYMAPRRRLICLIVVSLVYQTAARKHRAINVRKQLEYLEQLITRNTFELRQDIFSLEDQINTTRNINTNVGTNDIADTTKEINSIRNEVDLYTGKLSALAHGLSKEKQFSFLRIRKQDEDLQAFVELFNSKFSLLESRITGLEADFEEFKRTLNQSISNILETSNEKVNRCPLNGFVWQSSCYVLNTGKLNWTSAVNECKARGGHLAILETEEEMRFVLPRLGQNTWLGGHDTDTEGQWAWIGEDTEIEFLLWEPGQPNGTGDCMEAYNGLLNDERCTVSNNFVCEFSI